MLVSNFGDSVRKRNWGFLALLCVAIGPGAAAGADDGGKRELTGFAWTQYQNGMTPMYKGAANFDHNPFFNAGAMLFLDGKPMENWETHISVGLAYFNTAIKKSIWGAGDVPVAATNPHSISIGMGAFLHEAKIGYGNGGFDLTLGKFHYKYSDYNTNLGLYLLRGPVYPGFLYSGFEQIGGITKTGALVSWAPSGSFRWDLLATFETDFKPFMDLNLSGFLSYKAGMLELGTGFESQRLVEFNSCVTSPKDEKDLSACLGGNPGNGYTGGTEHDLYKGAYFITDTVGGRSEVTTYSLAGTKVMARGALDFKRAVSYEGSPKDLILYFEAALLGVKDYPHIYADKARRIPVLVGLNVPTFGLLELLSLELEYYDSPYQNDPYKLVGAYDVFEFSDGNSINYAMSPIPPSSKAGHEHLSRTAVDYDPGKDNLKWSLFASKKVRERITLKVQIASDHWRVPNNNFVQYEAVANPRQFYGSMRIDYAI